MALINYLPIVSSVINNPIQIVGETEAYYGLVINKEGFVEPNLDKCEKNKNYYFLAQTTLSKEFKGEETEYKPMFAFEFELKEFESEPPAKSESKNEFFAFIDEIFAPKDIANFFRGMINLTLGMLGRNFTAVNQFKGFMTLPVCFDEVKTTNYETAVSNYYSDEIRTIFVIVKKSNKE